MATSDPRRNPLVHHTAGYPEPDRSAPVDDRPGRDRFRSFLLSRSSPVAVRSPEPSPAKQVIAGLVSTLGVNEASLGTGVVLDRDG